MDFRKPERKQVRAFSIAPDTAALIDKAARIHQVSASRIVDTALQHYLTHILTLRADAPEEK